MRVLLATHLYPPVHNAGVEVFASVTASHVAGAGHEVVVVTTEKDIARPDLSTREREHGLRVVEIINNLFARSFEETWRRSAIDRVLAGVLDDVRPDLVHVHHLLYLSAGLLDLCEARGIPVVMTIHDWLGCARFGRSCIPMERAAPTWTPRAAGPACRASSGGRPTSSAGWRGGSPPSRAPRGWTFRAARRLAGVSSAVPGGA